MCPLKNVVLDLRANIPRYWRLRDMPGYDDAWEEEHGSAVLAAPVSGRQLHLLEEGETILDCIEGGLGFRELWKVLVKRLG
jgi:hypothetical protein